MKNEKGFTLVEIAIVMVIIGLLLGGALKGQSMIKNAEIGNVINDSKGISAAVLAYRDRYRALPGDDIDATTNLFDATLTNGDASGALSAAEATQAFEHLRVAGLLKGSGVTSPLHALGGNVTFIDGAYGLSGLAVCNSGVSGDDALIIDKKEDDGVSNTGSVQSGLRSNRVSTTYQDTRTYFVCFEG